MNFKERKKIARKNLTIWLNKLKISDEEHLFIYPTDDGFYISVISPDGSYRRDKVKTLKEMMGK